jgi:predicted enzyme related to lactoylglutathione lyase
MDFVSIRIITEDVERLAGFYEKVTGVRAERPGPDFAEVVTAYGTLAIGSTRTAPAGIVPGANRSVIIEFRVDDVDAAWADVAGLVADGAEQEPTTMPWGNRSVLFRDPDGNLVNLFAPVTPAAIERFSRRSR